MTKASAQPAPGCIGKPRSEHAYAPAHDGPAPVADHGGVVLNNNRIRRVTLERIRGVTLGLLITTEVGPPGGPLGDTGARSIAYLTQPSGVAIDFAGKIFIADTVNSRILEASADGTVTRVAGGGIGDGGPATNASLNYPRGIAIGPGGDVFIADWLNSRIRKVNPSGTIMTVAGNADPGYSGDDVTATSASLLGPTDVAVDAAGNLFIADSGNNRIRRVDTSGTITTVAGDGGAGYSGDGGPAPAASLNLPRGIAVDAAGNLFIADTDNHRIRMVSTDGTMTTVVGNGLPFYGGIEDPATQSRVDRPHAVDVDGSGNLFIADTGHHRICKRSVSGAITSPAGEPNSAGLTYPKGVAVDPAGNIFIADTDNLRILEISA